MNLYLIGHDYRYAAEQMLLTLFPDERPVYPDGRPTGDRAELRLMSGAKVTTATCVLVYQGRTANGRTSVPNEELTDPNETDRRLQGAVKRAFYRAAMGIGLPHRPWGMLTGVRPGKLMTPLLAQGMGDVQAARYFERHYDVAPARAALVVRTAHATLRAMDSLGEKDVCLYVGIPFCPTRCAYCSFVSQSVEKSMALVPEFLQALAREIAATAEAVHRAGLRVVSLYIGGGTPTTLSARQLDALCTQLDAAFDLSALREFTVEAGRPDTITADKLHVLRAHRVDRISVNPQTLDDRVLETIGRRHTAQDIYDALQLVRATGRLCREHGPDRRPARRHAGRLSHHARAGARARARKYHRAHALAQARSRPLAADGARPRRGAGRRDARLCQYRARHGGLRAVLPLPAEVHVRRI